MLHKLVAAHKAGQLQFFGKHARLAERKAFAAYLAPLRQLDWYVYAKAPFGGPKAVLAYLSRYTHRVAISNRRLVTCDGRGVTFKYKNYRADGSARHDVMTLATPEFIRRFLMHVLPSGFHRIRHYGLFASGSRADNIARARQLLATPKQQAAPADAGATDGAEQACPCCGGRMLTIETFARGATPHHRPTASNKAVKIDTS